jgi:hypothetical protein
MNPALVASADVYFWILLAEFFSTEVFHTSGLQPLRQLSWPLSSRSTAQVHCPHITA